MSQKSQTTPPPPLPTTSERLRAILQDLEIKYKIYEHDAVFSVKEGRDLKARMPGVHTRNLFLRDKKGAMYLITLPDDKPVDLKKLQDLLECGRLSFGSPERLMEYMGIYPGAVCPFCAINDTGHRVRIILDKEMMAAGLINAHPLDNTQTISLTPDDLMKFFAHTGHEPAVLDLREAAPEGK